MNNLKELNKISSEYNVLYVEDEEGIAQTLIKYLSKFFKEVVYAENGEEGLNLYQKNKFDIVITDIMMPKMSGLEMSKEIKKIHPNQNIIVISAYAEIENFLESIKLGIDGYIIKPINYEDMNKTLFKTVSKIKNLKDNQNYEKKLQELLAKFQIDNEKLKQFTEVIDKVAVVLKTDTNGTITYLNDFFSVVSGYSKDELAGQSYNAVSHPDMPSSVNKQMWEKVKNGEIWEGTFKNKAKDGGAYFLHTTILPLFDIEQNINEFIGIGFLTTDEETEKREFKKKVMTNYLEFKKTNMNAISMISSLTKEAEEYKQKFEMSKVQLEKIEKKYNRAEKQISFYEKNLKERDSQQQKILDMQKNNLIKISDSHKKSLTVIQKQKNEISHLKKEQDIKSKEIVKLNGELNEQTNIILDLRDTIKNINED